MAHVGDDRRGQVMVVLSLVLAVMLVAMALYLNTAIFTENLATRKGDIAGAGGAASYKFAVVEGAASAMATANYDDADADHAEIRASLEADLANWSDAAERLESARGRSANVSVADTHDGTRIIQDADREFTNMSGVEDWYVVNDTHGVRNFRMDVSSDDLGNSWPGNAPHADPRFSVTFEDGTTVREVQVYGNHSNDDIHVTVLDGAGNELGSSCTVNEPDAVVDVTGATLDGEDCEALRFFGDLDDTYDVSYSNASYAAGTYELIANQSNMFEVAEHYNTDDTSPYYVDALYATDVRVTYRTARIDYATEVTVAPGEHDG